MLSFNQYILTYLGDGLLKLCADVTISFCTALNQPRLLLQGENLNLYFTPRAGKGFLELFQDFFSLFPHKRITTHRSAFLSTVPLLSALQAPIKIFKEHERFLKCCAFYASSCVLSMQKKLFFKISAASHFSFGN